MQQSLESIENASKIEREKNDDIINQMQLENEDNKIKIQSLKEKINNSGFCEFVVKKNSFWIDFYKG